MRLIPIDYYYQTMPSTTMPETTIDPFAETEEVHSKRNTITSLDVQNGINATNVNQSQGHLVSSVGQIESAGFGAIGVLVLVLVSVCFRKFTKCTRRRRTMYPIENTDAELINIRENYGEIVERTVIVPPPPQPPVCLPLPISPIRDQHDQVRERYDNIPPPTHSIRESKLTAEQQTAQRLLGEKLGEIYAKRSI